MDGFGTTIEAPAGRRDHYRQPGALVLEKSFPALDPHDLEPFLRFGCGLFGRHATRG